MALKPKQPFLRRRGGEDLVARTERNSWGYDDVRKLVRQGVPADIAHFVALRRYLKAGGVAYPIAPGHGYVASILTPKRGPDGLFVLTESYFNGHHIRVYGAGFRNEKYIGEGYTDSYPVTGTDGNKYYRTHTPSGVFTEGVGLGFCLYTSIALAKIAYNGANGAYSISGTRSESAEEWWHAQARRGYAETDIVHASSESDGEKYVEREFEEHETIELALDQKQLAALWQHYADLKRGYAEVVWNTYNPDGTTGTETRRVEEKPYLTVAFDLPRGADTYDYYDDDCGDVTLYIVSRDEVPEIPLRISDEGSIDIEGVHYKALWRNYRAVDRGGRGPTIIGFVRREENGESTAIENRVWNLGSPFEQRSKDPLVVRKQVKYVGTSKCMNPDYSESSGNTQTLTRENIVESPFVLYGVVNPDQGAMSAKLRQFTSGHRPDFRMEPNVEEKPMRRFAFNDDFLFNEARAEFAAKAWHGDNVPLALCLLEDIAAVSEKHAVEYASRPDIAALLASNEVAQRILAKARATVGGQMVLPGLGGLSEAAHREIFHAHRAAKAGHDLRGPSDNPLNLLPLSKAAQAALKKYGED